MQSEKSDGSLSAALEYLHHGWVVIPLNGKQSLVKWLEFQQRCPTEAEVHCWWTQWPHASIGVVCGKVSGGLAVLDIDDKQLAERLLGARVCDQTRVSRTPRGGIHLFVQETETTSRSGPLVSGVADLKAEGGYVVVPPSIGYAQVSDATPKVVPDARAWAISLLQGMDVQIAQLPARIYQTLAEGPVSQGVRNTVLTSVAGVLRRAGVDADTIEAALEGINERRCRTPLDEKEIQAIAKSVGRYPPGNPENTIPARYEPDLAGIESWEPIPITTLHDSEPIPWVWRGYIPANGVTLLTGLWKAGKTTLVTALLQAMADGRELADQPVATGKALVVTEEARGMWQRRREEWGLGDNVDLFVRPFKGKPRWEEWKQFVDRLCVLIGDRNYRLVIIDTLPSFLPVQDENDASQAVRALGPVHHWTEAGAGVLLSHHPRKGDATEGQASRGSGALPGFVDVVLEFRRYDASDRRDTRRTLITYSRFDESPAEVVLDYKERHYTVVGTKGEARRQDRLPVALALLPSAPPGITINEIVFEWPSDGPPKPGGRTLAADLELALEQGRVQRTGEGKKGTPYRFWLDSIPASPEAHGAGIDLGGGIPEVVLSAAKLFGGTLRTVESGDGIQPSGTSPEDHSA